MREPLGRAARLRVGARCTSRRPGTAWDTSVFPDAGVRRLRAAGEEGRTRRRRRRRGRRAHRDPVRAGRAVTPRLVATDLDGTLLHSDGTVTARTRAVLAELDDLGVPVVFTTGRPIRWMEELWDASAATGWRSAATAGSCTTSPAPGARLPRGAARGRHRRSPSWCGPRCRARRSRSSTRPAGRASRLPQPPRRPPSAGRRARWRRSSATTWSRCWPCTPSSTPRTSGDRSRRPSGTW